MAAHPAPRMADCFGDLVDPRVHRANRHALRDLGTIAVGGVICGAEHWGEGTGAPPRGRGGAPGSRRPTGFPPRSPCGRGFGRLDPAQFEAGFRRGAPGVAGAPAGAVLAIEGTTIRAARGPGGTPSPIVSAGARAHRLVLGQAAVEQKSKESGAIPARLARVRGRRSPRWAASARAAQSVAPGGDYVLARQANQPELRTNGREQVRARGGRGDPDEPDDRPGAGAPGRPHRSHDRRSGAGELARSGRRVAGLAQPRRGHGRAAD